MKFSIITVCKNSEKTIEKAILSVVTQTYKDLEYIIIDGVSEDKTLEIIDKYKDNFSHVISEADEGLYDAMNKGINIATGDYLFFLNSDDSFLHDNILRLVAEQIQNLNFDLVYGDILVLDKESGVINIQKHNKFNKIYLMKNTPCQPATFYKKQTFDKYGLFDKNYKIVSDHEWFLRAFLKNKPKSKYLGFVINIFSTGGISTSKNREQKLIEERNYMLDNYFSMFERVSFDFISKKCRSLTTIPILSDFLNIFFRFKF